MVRWYYSNDGRFMRPFRCRTAMMVRIVDAAIRQIITFSATTSPRVREYYSTVQNPTRDVVKRRFFQSKTEKNRSNRNEQKTAGNATIIIRGQGISEYKLNRPLHRPYRGWPTRWVSQSARQNENYVRAESKKLKKKKRFLTIVIRKHRPDFKQATNTLKC